MLGLEPQESNYQFLTIHVKVWWRLWQVFYPLISWRTIWKAKYPRLTRCECVSYSDPKRRLIWKMRCYWLKIGQNLALSIRKYLFYCAKDI